MLKLFKIIQVFKILPTLFPLCRIQLGGMLVMPNRIITRGPIIGGLIIVIPVETGLKKVKAFYEIRAQLSFTWQPVSFWQVVSRCYSSIVYRIGWICSRNHLILPIVDAWAPCGVVFLFYRPNLNLWRQKIKSGMWWNEIWFRNFATIFVITWTDYTAWFLQCRLANRQNSGPERKRNSHLKCVGGFELRSESHLRFIHHSLKLVFSKIRSHSKISLLVCHVTQGSTNDS
jgi:hypothetical protein